MVAGSPAVHYEMSARIGVDAYIHLYSFARTQGAMLGANLLRMVGVHLYTQGAPVGSDWVKVKSAAIDQ